MVTYAETVRSFFNMSLLHTSGDAAMQLALNNTPHSGDNTFYPLGANWLLRGLLSKAVFAHITVQQLIDLYKPLHRWTFTT